MTITSKTDGQILDELMAEFSYGVTSLARRLKVDRATIYVWKNDQNKGGISFENWLAIGKALNIDIHKYVPKLKKFKKAEVESVETDDTLGMVKELEGKYYSTQKDVQFLKDRIGDYEDIIAAKNEVINVQKEQIASLKMQLAKYEKK